MILALQDGGTTVYNSLTGEPVLLSGKADRKARRAQRQKAKTIRQSTRQQVKQERQNKKLIRVKGKQAVIKARTQSRINKFLTPSSSEETQQGSFIPSGSTSGGGGGGGGGLPSFDPSGYDSGYIDPTYNEEIVYDDPEAYTPYDDVTEDEESLNAGGIIGTALQGLKGLVNAYLPNSSVSAVLNPEQLQNLQKQNYALQSQLNKAKQNQFLFGVGGIVLGSALGYIIFKK